MRKALALSFAVVAVLLSLPITMPSQPPPPDRTMQRERMERIKYIKQKSKEMIELQRELNVRRFLEQVGKRGFSDAEMREIRKQYDIPPDGGLRGLDEPPDLEIPLRIDDLQRDVPRRTVTQSIPLMIYGDLDIQGIAENSGPPSPDNPFVRNENVLRVARSVAAVVKRDRLIPRAKGKWSLKVDSLKSVGSQALCEYERWYGAMKTDVLGTGFLIGDSTIATAGHVAQSIDGGNSGFLGSVYFLFGYVMENDSSVKTIYTDDDVYEGRAVEKSFSPRSSDWALIHLDRKVVGREPLKCRREGKVADRSRVYMIGHPHGLPQQYSWNGQVLDNTPCSIFFADLDCRTYNSGSPVINADSSRAGRPLVEGILVSDKASYEEVCECVVMRRWSPHAGRPGAEVTRSTEFAGVLENKDSVLVRCRLGEGVGAISPPSLDTLWVLGDQEERYLPWCEYFYLVQPGLTCHLVYRPDRGSVWEIVPWKIVDAVEGTSIKIKMEKVCFP